MPAPISSVAASARGRGNSPTPMRNSAMYARCASRKHTSPGTKRFAGPISSTSPASEKTRPVSSSASKRAMPPGWRCARRAAKAMAIASANGLKRRCSQPMPKAALAVASAAASTSSTSVTDSRPCSTAPTAHSPAVSAASQTAACGSGTASEYQRNTVTPASSARNCRPANHCTPRLTTGS
ncbi:hypothetical protein D9M72_129540 [compost metagenome]